MIKINNIQQFFIGNIQEMNINWEFVNTIPEFNILNDTKQNSIWHKEGNVMIHTKMVCDAMKSQLMRESNINKISYMMLSALFHDIGKGPTTKLEEDGLYHCKNHGAVGERITRNILWNIDFDIREKICALVNAHMKPLYFLEKENIERYIIELSMLCDIQELCMLKQADCIGAINDGDEWETTLSLFIEKTKELNCYTAPYQFINNNCKFKYFSDKTLNMPPVYSYEDFKFKVIIMCGLPGSGKDTFISENYKDMPTVCRDDIRTQIGLKGDKPKGNKKEESKVTEIVNDYIKNYCRNNISFVINATSLKKMHREQLINMVIPYNPFIEIVYIEAPTIEDNLKRRKGQIPEKVILDMQAYMDFPRTIEAHNIIFIKQ